MGGSTVFEKQWGKWYAPPKYCFLSVSMNKWGLAKNNLTPSILISLSPLPPYNTNLFGLVNISLGMKSF